MKRIHRMICTLLLITLFIFGLTGCTGEKKGEADEKDQRVTYRTVFSEEVANWLDWFNELAYEDQLSISYRPYEIYEYLKDGSNTLMNELRDVIAIDYGRLKDADSIQGRSYSTVDENVRKIYDIETVSTLGSGSLPVGGYEKEDEAAYYNRPDRINRSNCYSYSLDFITESTVLFTQQPGYLSGAPITIENCTIEGFSGIIEAVKKDLPFIESVVAIRPCTEDAVPGPLEYKAALVIAPGKDYHWYRQNPDGTWSHKRGHQEISRLDASGNTVYAPHLCDRNYGKYDYSYFAGYFFVRYGNVFHDNENCVLNSFMTDTLGCVEELTVTESEVRFEYKGKAYSFILAPVKETNMEGVSVKAYFGISGNLACKVSEYADSYCMEIADYEESIVNRQKDTENNFTIIASKDLADRIEEVISFRKSQHN